MRLFKSTGQAHHDFANLQYFALGHSITELTSYIQWKVEPLEFRGILFEAIQDRGRGWAVPLGPQAQWASPLPLTFLEDKSAMEYKVSCSLEARFSWQTFLFIPQQDGYGSSGALPYLEALGGFILTKI